MNLSWRKTEKLHISYRCYSYIEKNLYYIKNLKSNDYQQ